MDWHDGLVLTWHCMVMSSSLGKNLNLTLYLVVDPCMMCATSIAPGGV